MPFTVNDFQDLVSLLETHPAWQANLRRLLLSDALLSMPEQLAELRARSEEQFQTLLATQQHLEARVTTLAEGQQRLEERITALEERVTALEERITTLAEGQQRLEERVITLIEAQQQTETQVADLARTMSTLTNDVGELKGKSLEADYRVKGSAYFSRLVRRPHVLTADELMILLEDAQDSGTLSAAEAQEIYDADLVVRGRRPEDGSNVYLVVEVSWGVGPQDVTRAARRAALLAHIGTAAIPVVAGKRITPEAVQLAHSAQVWRLTNGHAISPTS